MTIADVAAYARCSARTVYRAVESGRLRAGRKGVAQYVVRREDVDAWLFQPRATEDSEGNEGHGFNR